MPIIGPHPPPVFRVLRTSYRKWMATQAIDLTGSDVTQAGKLTLTGNVGSQRIVNQVKLTITTTITPTTPPGNPDPPYNVVRSQMAPVTANGVFSTQFTGLTAGTYNAVAAITTVAGKSDTGGPYTVT